MNADARIVVPTVDQHGGSHPLGSYAKFAKLLTGIFTHDEVTTDDGARTYRGKVRQQDIDELRRTVAWAAKHIFNQTIELTINGETQCFGPDDV